MPRLGRANAHDQHRNTALRALTVAEASELLATLGLTIGGWNELVEITKKKAVNRRCTAPKEARALYLFSQQLLEWLSSKTSDWVLLQIDNSTSPLPDEVTVFELLVWGAADHWDVATQRTFVIEMAADRDADVATRLRMLIFISLMFEWHIHLTCQRSVDGRRLGLLDGVAYLFGDEVAVSEFQESGPIRHRD
jgi:hypothetical protein